MTGNEVAMLLLKQEECLGRCDQPGIGPRETWVGPHIAECSMAWTYNLWKHITKKMSVPSEMAFDYQLSDLVD